MQPDNELDMNASGNLTSNEIVNEEVKNETVETNSQTEIATEEETKPTVNEVEEINTPTEIVADSLAITDVNELEETNLSSEIVVEDIIEPAVNEAEEANAQLEVLEEIKKPAVYSEAKTEDTEPEPEIDYSVLDKKQLIEHLEESLKAEDVNSIKNKVSSIKINFVRILKEEKQKVLDKFIEDGGKKEEFLTVADEVELKFNEIFNIYKTRKNSFNLSLEKQKLENLAKKRLVLEELKALVSSDGNLKKTYDDFKALQDRWKDTGQVPRTEIEDLWNNYNFFVEKFFEKVKLNKELKDLDLKKNLEIKMQLCEKAEELLIEKSINKSFKKLQELHDEWKDTGPVPADKKDEIWERFKAVSDKINVNRKDYYESLHGEQEANFQTKTALCEKMEQIIAAEIITPQDWKEKTEQVDELEKLWKSVGQAPVKLNDEVWARFKAAVNGFYNIKKEFFSELKDNQINNYNQKVNICIEAESLKENTNWKLTTNALLKLQEEWKKVGPVPKKHSDKVWKRFRAACDDFFHSKQKYYANIQNVEVENLNKKEELIKKVKEFGVGENKSANLESLKNIQREWMEIGHVPMDQKDKLQNEFRTAINELMDKLKISSAEVSTMDFKNRLDVIKNSPEAGRILSKEKSFLEQKINGLKGEINLWENNLGFLAASKKADILRSEFEKKIKDAKNEVLIMETKLKMIMRSKN
jgi:hypothetical protein